jgi:TonB-dependent receptor
MKNIITLSLALFTSLLIYGQKGTIRGTVFEKKTGETLIGVAVVLEGTTSGTTTDLDGQFSLSLDPGLYTLKFSFISFQTLTIESIEVKPGDVTLLSEVFLEESSMNLQEVVVAAEAIRNTENSLMTIKRNSATIMDGISSARIQLTGDATAVEAVKRVTGVSIEGGKYVYVRGLGDRYSKTMLNQMDVPGLDPDRNSVQMDIFPTNLVANMMVSKNFTADLPADFTGGVLNIETKDFPEEKTISISFSTSVNPNMHFNPDFISYKGGATDFLGFDDGTRALPDGAERSNIPTPINPTYSTDDVSSFIRSFNPTVAVENQTSLSDFSLGFSVGNQIDLIRNGENTNNKLGYIFSLAYKNEYDFFEDATYGEYQRFRVPADAYQMRYATIQNGSIGDKNVLVGAIGGLAYKTPQSKIRLTLMHLQNGQSRAAEFNIDNDGEAVGQSGYLATSNNLEYSQRSLTNLFLGGEKVYGNSGWETDWRLSPTYSTSLDPDIRKTAFTYQSIDTIFSAGAAGNPSRTWRSLAEINTTARFDATRKYNFREEDAKLKFGVYSTFKYRDYEIRTFDVQFWGSQSWVNPDISTVLDPENLFPNSPNGIYFASGNGNPNPNEYQSNSINSAGYISNEFTPLPKLKTIIGVRFEYYALRHTGRDAQVTRSLDNELVLESFDLFPSANFIYQITDNQNLRTSYGRTIARPTFKEMSFAQIIDPITNRIFNGSFLSTNDWDGKPVETRIDNLDLRWELFMQNGQLFSMSAFYKHFNSPLELVRIPEQQTSTEYQVQNVGDGKVLGIEFEFRKDLNFIAEALSKFNVSGNITLVQSEIEMSESEFRSRKNYEREGETIDNSRVMAGQAPYVINGGITYSNPESGWESGLFYNVKGKTLVIVGGGLFPDIYEDPFHGLNFSLQKKVGKTRKTSIDFKVSNILNDSTEIYYSSFRADNQPYDVRFPGISFGIGVSHLF